ncbi:hypothetical protein [Arthrobacter sp. AOP36-A1-22]|uniref:hypothetical protein n=1 Tax=Arthrobacter sp. AOP36-A1-22 TaxID=3457684 RepID=UPI0040332ECA
MSTHETDSAITKGSQHTARRTIVKGAAWSIPVVAAAMAAPLAAASVNNASLAFTDTETGLLALRVLGGGGVVNAQALVTVPTELTLTNGPGALEGLAAITVTVGRPAGINIPLGRARGFGVASYNGVDSTDGQRTAVYQKALGVRYGFPLTTFTTSQNISVASNGQLVFPIEFGLAGSSTGVSVSILARFPVTITMIIDGKTFTATSNVRVPVGAGIL